MAVFRGATGPTGPTGPASLTADDVPDIVVETILALGLGAGATGPTGPPSSESGGGVGATGATGAPGSGVTFTVDDVQDIIAQTVVAAPSGPIILTYNDELGTLTVDLAQGSLAAGPGVALSYDELTHTMTVGTISKLNTQTSTTYTPVWGDAGAFIALTNAAPIKLIVPTDAAVPYPIGTRIDLAQMGTGQVTVAGATGVTVNGTPGLRTRSRYSGATLMKMASNAWLLIGDLI